MHGGITYTLFSVPRYNGANLGAVMAFYGVFDDNAKPTDAQ